MTGLIKMALVGAGIIGAVVGLTKLNDAYKEKHDGRGMVEDAMDTMEKHPVATVTVGTVALILGIAAANSYTEAHRTPEWYELQAKREEARVQIHQAELEEERRRDEIERLEAQRRRQEDLDFKRQMPEGYWNAKCAMEQRKAREIEAQAALKAAKYVSDNDLEAAKHVSDNELEAKIIKNKAKETKENANKEEEVA